MPASINKEDIARGYRFESGSTTYEKGAGKVVKPTGEKISYYTYLKELGKHPKEYGSGGLTPKQKEQYKRLPPSERPNFKRRIKEYQKQTEKRLKRDIVIRRPDLKPKDQEKILRDLKHRRRIQHNIREIYGHDMTDSEWEEQYGELD